MKVKDLIKDLRNVNPEALIILTVGNKDQNIFSSSQWEIHGIDNDSYYIEFFMSDEAPQQL